jgi:hypothetical protein
VTSATSPPIRPPFPSGTRRAQTSLEQPEAEEDMTDRCELAVRAISYVGPHPIEAESYEIELRVEPTPEVAGGLVILKFRPSEAAFLAQLMRLNPPPATVDETLLRRVAAHET